MALRRQNGEHIGRKRALNKVVLCPSVFAFEMEAILSSLRDLTDFVLCCVGKD